MKRIINVITLIVMISVNLMNPFTYAISLGEDFSQTQEFLENMQVKDDNDDLEKNDKNGNIIEENGDNEDEIITELNEENNDNDGNIKEDGDDMNKIGIKLNQENSENTEEQEDIKESSFLSDLEKEGKDSGLEEFSISPIIETDLESDSIEITYYLNGGYRVEDSTTNPKTITYTKNDSGYYIASEYYKTPSKETGCGEDEDKKCMFAGWYDQSLAVRWTGNFEDSMNVYAKWLPFEDLEVYMFEDENTKHQYTLMDRNIGAKTNNISNTDSYGYHYQFGNNYGFECSDFKCSKFLNNEDTIQIKFDDSFLSEVNLSKFYYNKRFTNDDYFSGSDYIYSMWGGNSLNTGDMQGPCPDGYHIPSYNNNEWKNIAINWDNSSVFRETSNNFSKDFLMPKSSYNGSKEQIGAYRLSTTNGKNQKYGRYISSFLRFGDDYATYFRSVRCIKDEQSNSYNVSKIHLNGGSKFVISIVGGRIASINIPVKSGYIFDGWYKTSDFSGPAVSVGDFISESDDLYAKWTTCPEGTEASYDSKRCMPDSATKQKERQIVKDLELYFVQNDENRYHYTIMDRNMGATEVYNQNSSNPNETSFGYVYQFGNNYGFPGTGNLDDYGISKVGQFPKSERVGKIPSNFSVNVWSLTNNIYAEGNGYARGGRSDDWGNPNSDLDSRQGPCPDEYFLPSRYEVNELFDNYTNSSNDAISNNFMNMLLLPKTFVRDSGGNLPKNNWLDGAYRTSTPRGWHTENQALAWNIKMGFHDDLGHAYGAPVRCFKKVNNEENIFNISHIILNGGEKAVISILSGEIVSLGTPILEGKNFQGWYTTSGFDEGTEVTVGNIISTGDYLYAKWGDCPEGYILDEVTHKCIMTAAEQKRQQIVEDLDVYMLGSDTDKNHYTLMDRNMGATGIYNNDYSNPNINSLGYYYQWGNNYGFDSKVDNPGILNHITGNTVDASSYSWSNPYESYWFVGKDSNSKNWMKSINKNLWGGEESDVSRKQGPCPDGYHVPSVDEWRGLVTSYSNAINGGLKLSRYLLLPAAGYRDRGFGTVGSINGNGNYVYASSSLNGNSLSDRILYVLVSVGDGDLNVSNSSNNNPKHEWSSNGVSVRCLKNEVNTGATAIDKNDIHLGGGSKAIISMLSSGEVIAMQNPTRTSGTFSGWYTNENFTGDAIVVGSVIERGSSLYAKWSCPAGQIDNGTKCVGVYTITFDADNGNVDTNTKTVVYGNIYNDLPVATREGYIFKGWYANFNGLSNYVNYGREYMFTDQISFHASAYMDTWDTGKRIVSSTQAGGWALNGGENGKVKVTAFKNDSNFVIAESNITWASLPSGWHDFDFVFDGDQLKLYLDGNLIANSTSGEFTNGIVYNPNNVILVGAEVGYSTTPENPGYYFKGKIKDVIIQNSTGLITSGEAFNTIVAPNQNITLHAEWEPIEYNINYMGIDGATFENQNPSKYTIESGEIILNNPTKEYYNFIGWSGTNIVGTSNHVVIPTNSTGDRIYEANWETEKYTITWKDGNNSILKEEQVSYGVVPSYTGSIPTKTPTAQTGYTFNNTWNPIPYAVNGNENYVAQFDESVNKYTIKFIDGDGQDISSEEYDYGTTKNNIQIPTNVTKTFTPMTGYIFAGWDKEIGTVTTGTTYTAQFDEYTRSYLITWKNSNGEIIDSGEVLYGAIPSHADVESGGNAEYTYIFSGWIPKIVAVTTGATYTADYVAQKNKYLIKFVNEDGTVLQSDNIEYGETPIYSGETPEKPNTEQYTYRFIGRGESIVAVTGPKVYTAHYETNVNKYTISWNIDGNITEAEYEYGQTPTHERPEKASDGTYDYEFLRWEPEIQPVTGNAAYTAVYTPTYIDYTISFVDYDGTPLSGATYHSGDIVIEPEHPTRPSTQQYTYIFTGWGETILPVTGPKVYTAHYDEIINKYTITWIDGNGDILYSGEVDWGEMPVYSGSIPTKTSTVDYNYTFNGNWLPEIKVVTGDMQYVAQFDEEHIKRDEGGNYSGAGKRKSGDDTKQTHGSADEDKSDGSSNEGTTQQEKNTLPDNSSETSEGENTKIVTIKDTEIVATVRDIIISNNSNYTKEFNEAYSFAKSNGITTTDSIETAKMNTELTRIEMAKILSNYAINILGQEPDVSKGTIKFNDVTNKLNSQYDNAVTKAYQLGIMGQNMKNNEFRPNDEVTRAEFATALSRLLYQTEEGEYKGTRKYYEPHIAKLYNEGIINKTDPKIKEKRGYVMIMLMRTIKN